MFTIQECVYHQRAMKTSNPTQDLLDAFDGHDVEGTRTALKAGADACSPIRDKAPICWLLEQYWRSDRLPTCLQLLLDHGAVLHDPFLIPVLLDHPDEIKATVLTNP